MTTVYYPTVQPYRAVPQMGGSQPAVEVELVNGTQTARAVGILDSGSVFTVFSSEFAELLGIEDVTTGRLNTVSTLGGSRDVYMFDLELRMIGVQFPAQIGFFAIHASRNILGRSVIFSRFQIGFHESANQLLFRAEY